MKQYTITTIKSFLIVLALTMVSLTALARDSLESLRTDLNTTNAKVGTLQAQLSDISNVRYVVIELEGSAQNGEAKILGPGIECTLLDGSASGDCSEVFPKDYRVTLKSSVGPNTLFNGWKSEPCSGLEDCVITVSDDLHLVAAFTELTNPDPNDFTIEHAQTVFPCNINASKGEVISIYGKVYAPGLTDISIGPNPSPNLIAEIGFGPHGNQPSNSAEWIWLSVNASGGNGAEDEYKYEGAPPLSEIGVYDYAFRFAKAGDGAYKYGDCNGSQDAYNIENAGILNLIAP